MNAEALIGKVLGTCTLQEVIGQGGMGAVFLAQQSRPRRQVAVKVLLPSTSLTAHQRTAFLERFRRETDAAASLEHPNILPVHEYGERDGLAYLVVPYISGGTLRDLLEREGQLPLPKALNYLEQLVAALDFAHERGVIHRDIKPANILTTPEGRLLLTDFGLVKIIADGQAPQMRLTGAGAPVGTPDYMAPEQVVGNTVDGRSDLYSLGIILYHMIVGTTPFHGETPMQIAAQQLQSSPPSPRLLRADLPIGAEQVMLRALSKRPDERYACGHDFAEAFRNALTYAGIPLNSVTGGTASVSSSTSARLFTPRGLFDPAWQADTKGTMSSHMAAINLNRGIPTASGPMPVANADAGTNRPAGGLLSRTGMFPKVAGTGHMPATPATMGNNLATGVLPASTGAQPTVAKPGPIPMPTGGYPAFTPPTGEQRRATGLLSSATETQLPFQTKGLDDLSTTRNTTGALMVPKNDQSASTMKLTGPVKVVQMPVAGQPGRYMTGLLPVVPQTQQTDGQPESLKSKRKNPWMTIVTLLVVLLVVSTGGLFWYFHGHTSQTKSNSAPSGFQTGGKPDTAATATAQVQATATANQILSDPLSQNIHNFPIGANEFFQDGSYRILNSEGNAVAVVLPQQQFNMPNVYTLTMWEVKGDDTSNNNSFGMILRFSQHTKSGKSITTFYSFEVLNIKGGEYRFYKYDDSQGTPDKYWTQLWRQPFGKEYNQGQGLNKINTISIAEIGANFSITVNNKFIKTIHDTALSGGSVGMLVNLKGTEVAFKNMLITHK